MPFNKQMPTERDVQVIEENRRLLGALANARDENAIRLEQKSSKESKTSLECENTVGQDSEKRALENGIANLDTFKNEDIVKSSISGRDGANVNCDPKLTKPETRVKDYVCDLDVNAMYSSPTPTPGVHTNDNFEGSLSKSQSCDSIKCTSPMRCVESELYQDSRLKTSCYELTMNAEPREGTDICSAKTIAEGCAQCDLLRSVRNSSFEESRDKFIAILGDAVRKRVWNLPRTNGDSVTSNFPSGSTSEANSFTSSGVQHKDARVGILFSGGIDSMMIAALADK